MARSFSAKAFAALIWSSVSSEALGAAFLGGMPSAMLFLCRRLASINWLCANLRLSGGAKTALRRLHVRLFFSFYVRESYRESKRSIFLMLVSLQYACMCQDSRKISASNSDQKRRSGKRCELSDIKSLNTYLLKLLLTKRRSRKPGTSDARHHGHCHRHRDGSHTQKLTEPCLGAAKASMAHVIRVASQNAAGCST